MLTLIHSHTYGLTLFELYLSDSLLLILFVIINLYLAILFHVCVQYISSFTLSSSPNLQFHNSNFQIFHLGYFSAFFLFFNIENVV